MGRSTTYFFGYICRKLECEVLQFMKCDYQRKNSGVFWGCAFVAAVVLFQSFFMLLHIDEEMQEKHSKEASITNVVSCFVPREWARQHPCVLKPTRKQYRQKHKQEDIAIVVLVNGFLGPKTRNATIQNKMNYCRKWNYTCVAPDIEEAAKFSGEYPFPWGKFPLLQDTLKRHKYALMIDGDAFINNMHDDMTDLIREFSDDRVFMLISHDFNGINSGVFLIKQSPLAQFFLQEAFRSAEILAFNNYLPLKYENRAFFYLLNSWPVCFGMRRMDSVLGPSYNETLSAVFSSGIKVIDRCRINVHPKTNEEGLTSSAVSFDSWDRNTFIIHAAGGDHKWKHDFIETYIRKK